MVHIFLKAAARLHSHQDGSEEAPGEEYIPDGSQLVSTGKWPPTSTAKFGDFCFFGRKWNYKIGQRAWHKQCKTAPSSKITSMGKEVPRLLQCSRFRLSETAWLPFLEEIVALLYSQKAFMSFLICKSKMQWHSTWKQWAAGRLNQLFSPE